MVTRRPPPLSRFRRGAIGAAARELGAPDCPLVARADAGLALTRAERARLRKTFLAAALPERVDHRSGVYAAAKRRVAAVLRAAERAEAELDGDAGAAERTGAAPEASA